MKETWKMDEIQIMFDLFRNNLTRGGGGVDSKTSKNDVIFC